MNRLENYIDISFITFLFQNYSFTNILPPFFPFGSEKAQGSMLSSSGLSLRGINDQRTRVVAFFAQGIYGGGI